MIELLVVGIGLLVFFFIGNYIEKSHYADIKRREQSLQIPVLFSNRMPQFASYDKVGEVKFVATSVVIGADRFKHVVSRLLSIFGGTLSPYESVLDRARREALLRLKEQATAFNVIINVKLETCIIGKVKGKQGFPKVSILAYGTAIKYQ